MRSERRYRYRLYPTKGQQRQLARTFGCARVVYNDAIALRRNQWEQGGVKVGYAELDRAVITDAKKTPERAWLSEVSTVALQQAVRHAHRAYVNWWQHGAEPPRMRRKHGRQAFRLTQRGFRVRGAGDGSDRARVHLAKIGWVKVAWSRPLPSPPTSVTIVREPDGRFYASFVCNVEQRDAGPAGSPGAGIDVGLRDLAVIVNADGSVEKVGNPRHVRAAERKLARNDPCQGRSVRGKARDRQRTTASSDRRSRPSTATCRTPDVTS